MRRLALVLALVACDHPAPDAPVRLRVFTDLFPDDPFAFVCAVQPAPVNDPSPTGCAMMLLACIDASIGSCNDDAKLCHEEHSTCMQHVGSACWAKLP